MGALSVFMLPAWRRKATKGVTMIRAIVFVLFTIAALFVCGELAHGLLFTHPGSAETREALQHMVWAVVVSFVLIVLFSYLESRRPIATRR